MHWNDPLNPNSPNSGIVQNGEATKFQFKSDGAFDVAGDLMKQMQRQARQNNAWSAKQAQKQMDFQRETQQIAMNYNTVEAAKNRDWQKMMSDTAHQREVKDLMAAGLNPVLSVTGGNGAATGSGATAAGASGASGAKGDPDTSSNAALASLMSAILSQRTQLEIADMNAKTNLAVAEKYNAISKYLGELQNSTSLYLGEKGLINSLSIAGIQAAASQSVAGINAAASRYAADKSSQTAVYASNVQAWTNRAVAAINANASIVGHQITSQAQKYASDVSAATQKYIAEGGWKNAQDLQKSQQVFEDFIKRAYPKNVWEALGAFNQRYQNFVYFGNGTYGSPLDREREAAYWKNGLWKIFG